MEDFYRPSVTGRGGPIVPTTVSGTDFTLKNHMVQLLRQNCQFNRFKDEDENEYQDNPTPSPDPIVESLSPSLTPCGDSDLLLEETDAFLSLDDLIPPGINNGIYDLEGDILFLEGLLNDEIPRDLPPLELNNDPKGDIIFLEKLLKDEPLEEKNLKIDLLIRESMDTDAV
uniref:Reverse transcriptase domain-containing protein n=1 Tax=Tanacetum cinerariifolium TaxID=118510 RepID=A0A6L2N2K4_TANCI|nr:reverse transcriptase domain-containing protein [Tanacetum cinerariifolium]